MRDLDPLPLGLSRWHILRPSYCSATTTFSRTPITTILTPLLHPRLPTNLTTPLPLLLILILPLLPLTTTLPNPPLPILTPPTILTTHPLITITTTIPIPPKPPPPLKNPPPPSSTFIRNSGLSYLHLHPCSSALAASRSLPITCIMTSFLCRMQTHLVRQVSTEILAETPPLSGVRTPLLSLSS